MKSSEINWRIDELPADMREALDAALACRAMHLSQRVVLWTGDVQTFVVTLYERGEYAN